MLSLLLTRLKYLLGLEKPEQPQKIYDHEEEVVEEIHTIWDYLSLLDHTQAFHISSVVGFEEWVSMDEIRRRILELFGIEYKNERSLYPYIKTMVDLGLLESTSAGGKKKWRKRDLLIKIKSGKKEKSADKETSKATSESTEKKKSN
ncbi:MAG: hypothetical protein ABID38_02635 [Candidatus Diapherotrites archaeon]